MKFKLQKIKSDASFREFFRLYKGKKVSIIVTTKKEKFKNLLSPFLAQLQTFSRRCPH